MGAMFQGGASTPARFTQGGVTDQKAQDEFDRQAGRLFDEIASTAFMVVLLLAGGWGCGVILAHL